LKSVLNRIRILDHSSEETAVVKVIFILSCSYFFTHLHDHFYLSQKVVLLTEV